MESELTAEFDRVFSGQPAEALDYAFASWREVSQFIPTIADIRGLLKDWHRNKTELKSKTEQRAEKERLETGRATGEVVDLVDLKAELAHMCQMPIAPTAHQQKLKAAMERARRTNFIPPIQLTPEQIESRREREREECEKQFVRMQSLEKQNLDGVYKQQDNS